MRDIEGLERTGRGAHEPEPAHEGGAFSNGEGQRPHRRQRRERRMSIEQEALSPMIESINTRLVELRGMLPKLQTENPEAYAKIRSEIIEVAEVAESDSGPDAVSWRELLNDEANVATVEIRNKVDATTAGAILLSTRQILEGWIQRGEQAIIEARKNDRVIEGTGLDANWVPGATREPSDGTSGIEWQKYDREKMLAEIDAVRYFVAQGNGNILPDALAEEADRLAAQLDAVFQSRNEDGFAKQAQELTQEIYALRDAAMEGKYDLPRVPGPEPDDANVRGPGQEAVDTAGNRTDLKDAVESETRARQANGLSEEDRRFAEDPSRADAYPRAERADPTPAEGAIDVSATDAPVSAERPRRPRGTRARHRARDEAPAQKPAGAESDPYALSSGEANEIERLIDRSVELGESEQYARTLVEKANAAHAREMQELRDSIAAAAAGGTEARLARIEAVLEELRANPQEVPQPLDAAVAAKADAEAKEAGITPPGAAPQAAGMSFEAANQNETLDDPSAKTLAAEALRRTMLAESGAGIEPAGLDTARLPKWRQETIALGKEYQRKIHSAEIEEAKRLEFYKELQTDFDTRGIFRRMREATISRGKRKADLARIQNQWLEVIDMQEHQASLRGEWVARYKAIRREGGALGDVPEDRFRARNRGIYFDRKIMPTQELRQQGKYGEVYATLNAEKQQLVQEAQKTFSGKRIALRMVGGAVVGGAAAWLLTPAGAAAIGFAAGRAGVGAGAGALVSEAAFQATRRGLRGIFAGGAQRRAYARASAARERYAADEAIKVETTHQKLDQAAQRRYKTERNIKYASRGVALGAAAVAGGFSRSAYGAIADTVDGAVGSAAAETAGAADAASTPAGASIVETPRADIDTSNVEEARHGHEFAPAQTPESPVVGLETDGSFTEMNEGRVNELWRESPESNWHEARHGAELANPAVDTSPEASVPDPHAEARAEQPFAAAEAQLPTQYEVVDGDTTWDILTRHLGSEREAANYIAWLHTLSPAELEDIGFESRGGLPVDPDRLWRGDTLNLAKMHELYQSARAFDSIAADGTEQRAETVIPKARPAVVSGSALPPLEGEPIRVEAHPEPPVEGAAVETTAGLAPAEVERLVQSFENNNFPYAGQQKIDLMMSSEVQQLFETTGLSPTGHAFARIYTSPDDAGAHRFYTTENAAAVAGVRDMVQDALRTRGFSGPADFPPLGPQETTRQYLARLLSERPLRGEDILAEGLGKKVEAVQAASAPGPAARLGVAPEEAPKPAVPAEAPAQPPASASTPDAAPAAAEDPTVLKGYSNAQIEARWADTPDPVERSLGIEREMAYRDAFAVDGIREGRTWVKTHAIGLVEKYSNPQEWLAPGASGREVSPALLEMRLGKAEKTARYALELVEHINRNGDLDPRTYQAAVAELSGALRQIEAVRGGGTPLTRSSWQFGPFAGSSVSGERVTVGGQDVTERLRSGKQGGFFNFTINGQPYDPATYESAPNKTTQRFSPGSYRWDGKNGFTVTDRTPRRVTKN